MNPLLLLLCLWWVHGLNCTLHCNSVKNQRKKKYFLTCMFLNPNNFSNSTCSNLLDMRNFQEQVKEVFCSASNFKSYSPSLEQFFLTVGQNNFGNKIPLPLKPLLSSGTKANILFQSN